MAQQKNEGQDYNRQNYLTELKSIGKTFTNDFYPNYAKLYVLPEKQFVDRIDATRREFNTVLNKFKPALAPDFVKEQYLEIKYYFDKLLMDYPLNHDIYIGKTSKKRSAIPERLKGNLADFNKQELLGNSDFLNFVKSFFSYKINTEIRKQEYRNLDNQYLSAIWKLIPQYISDPHCKDYWQAEYLYNHIDNNGIKNIQNIYKNFKSSCKDTSLLKKITSLYSEDYVGRQGHLIKTYKTVGAFDLDVHLFLPDSLPSGNRNPVIIYFHGGSWSEGKPDWFFNAGENLSKNGWVVCAVEYRTFGRHGTLPFEAVMDAKSAIRWLRKNADEFNIDPDKIVASGNSAGGHLALCTALADQWNEKTDDLNISPVPNLLMINAGVYDLTDQITAWIRKDLKDKNLIKEISPNYLIKENLPPTLIIHGTEDQNVPYVTAKKFVEETAKAGNTTIDFHPLGKAGHFIWYDPKYVQAVSKIRADFLTKYGY